MSQPPQRFLFGPGPSPVPRRVREAMAMPLVGHLDPWFVDLLDEVSAGLRELFRTKNDLTLAVSGTGSAGMEAAIVNVVGPGDEVIVGINGVFGQRMSEVVTKCGGVPIRVEAPWGETIDFSLIKEAVEAHPQAAAVAIVHAETSTGVRQPVAEIGELLANYDAVFIVDAVTSLAGIEVSADEWDIDVCYSGTQKCLSVPPGLAPITFSPKAVERIEKRATPVTSWYFDMSMIRRYWGSERVYHHTAPISMLYGLAEGIRIVLEEGLQARWARHEETGRRLQDELISRGFTLFAAEGYRLPQLTSVLLPEKSDDRALRKRLLEDFGIEVGGGLGNFAGKMWRIGLMGEAARHENVDRLMEALDKIW
jgi:alanine-glyoxylate transaminase/serine-glyoxylate transaminase/serine-pyruvate transaminase